MYSHLEVLINVAFIQPATEGWGEVEKLNRRHLKGFYLLVRN